MFNSRNFPQDGTADKTEASPLVNEPKRIKAADKKHHHHHHRSHHHKEKQLKAKTHEEMELARTRKARSLREPSYLDRQQTAFQKLLEPQLDLKRAYLDHFMKHVFWKAKIAVQAEQQSKDKPVAASAAPKKQVRFKL